MVFSSQDNICVHYLKTAYLLVQIPKLASHYTVFVVGQFINLNGKIMKSHLIECAELQSRK